MYLLDPNLLKRAVAVPIYKSRNKNEATNYRPISLIPNIAQIVNFKDKKI